MAIPCLHHSYVMSYYVYHELGGSSASLAFSDFAQARNNYGRWLFFGQPFSDDILLYPCLCFLSAPLLGPRRVGAWPIPGVEGHPACHYGADTA